MQTTLNVPDDPRPAADAIFEAKAFELAAEGHDVDAMTEDELAEAVMSRLNAEEHRIVGTATIFRMAQIEIGKRIVECLEEHIGKIHRPDIAPCVTAYLESLADEEAEAA